MATNGPTFIDFLRAVPDRVESLEFSVTFRQNSESEVDTEQSEAAEVSDGAIQVTGTEEIIDVPYISDEDLDAIEPDKVPSLHRDSNSTRVLRRYRTIGTWQTVSDVAVATGLEADKVRNANAHLSDKGLIEKQQHPDGGNRYLYRITPTGYAAISRLDEKILDAEGD